MGYIVSEKKISFHLNKDLILTIYKKSNFLYSNIINLKLDFY